MSLSRSSNVPVSILIVHLPDLILIYPLGAPGKLLLAHTKVYIGA